MTKLSNLVEQSFSQVITVKINVLKVVFVNYLFGDDIEFFRRFKDVYYKILYFFMAKASSEFGTNMLVFSTTTSRVTLIHQHLSSHAVFVCWSLLLRYV
jgi:hypothetical protein